MGLFSKLFGIAPKNPDEKTFELWMEGEPSKMRRAIKIADIKGINFNEAVRNYLDGVNNPSVAMWVFDPKASHWKFFNRRVYDNAKEAQALCG